MADDDVILVNGDGEDVRLDIRVLSNMPDSLLNSSRISCAGGAMPEIVAQAEARGDDPSPAHSYCHAVVREAANRENWADLYSRMQPGQAVDEFNLIVGAAGQNQPSYVNVDGVTKNLDCELAFDAGYTWFSLNRHTGQAEPTISDDQIDVATRQCFDPAHNLSSYTGLVAGARLAYRDIQDQLLAEAPVQQTPVVEARGEVRVAQPD